MPSSAAVAVAARFTIADEASDGGRLSCGIGQAQHEATEVDRCSACYVNRDLQDYLMPVNPDIRDLQVILVPEIDHTVNPAGVRGLRELGNVGTAAAVAVRSITPPANASASRRSGSSS